MADYTPNINLYKPNRIDNLDIDVTLSENTVKVDTKFTDIDTQLADIATNVKKFGAVGDGVTDDTLAIQSAFNASKNIFFPDGSYVVSNTITIQNNTTVNGVGWQNTYIKSKVIDNKNIFHVVGTSVPGDSFYLKGMTIRNYETTKQDGYGIFVDGIINTTIEACYFRDLGGGGVKSTNLSNITLDKVYVFGCGVNTFYRSPTFGAIHIDRSGGFANTLNLINSYISNNVFMTGVLVAGGHSSRLVNVTIESCYTLLKIGDGTSVTRNISVFGLYLENPMVKTLDINNLLTGVFINTFNSTNSNAAISSLEMSVCSNVKFINCNLGDKGYVIDDQSLENIVFEDYQGAELPKGITGFNEPNLMKNIENYSGGVGRANNYAPNSSDLSTWGGSAVATLNASGFVDGEGSYVLSKTTAAHDKFFTVSKAFVAGEKINGSLYLLGRAEIKFRGTRTSDSVVEDIKKVSVIKDKWGRVFVGATLLVGYSSITFRVTPGYYSSINETCEVTKAQFEIDKVSPGSFVETKGTSSKQNTVLSSNGAFNLNTTLIDTNSAIPTTGTYKVGDIVFNKVPISGGYVGWVCTVAGTPGTWKGFGLIQA